MSRLPLVLLALVLAAPTALAQEVFRGLYTPDGRVRSAALAGDTLYVGGDFGLVAAPTGPLAVLDKTTGAPDLTQPRVSGLAFQEALQVVLPDGEGGYYVGGEFSGIGGVARRNLAHVLADGTVDPDFAPNPYGEINPFAFGQVEVLVLDGGVLYVGGRFDFVGGLPRRNIAALDPETGTVLPLSVTMTSATQGGADPRGLVETLAVRDGVLYAGGLFDVVNGQSREGAVAVRVATGAVLPWDLGLTLEGSSFGEATALGFGGSTLYVFGLFDRVRGAARGGSAEVSLADPVTGEGGVPTAWNPGFSGGGPYLAITDDYIWATSGFPPVLYRISRATGQSQGFLGNTPYRYGRDVVVDPTGGPSGQGVVYIAASVENAFAPRGSYPVVVGVDAVTGQPTGFEVIAGAGLSGGDYVAALAVEPGPAGRVFAAGSARQYDGAPRRFLAGLDLTTGRPTDLAEGYLIFSSVEETAVSPDERTLYFETFNGIGVVDLATGDIATFPAGGGAHAAWTAAPADTTGDAARGLVRRGERGGPVVARADGSPAPAFLPPVRDARRGASGGEPRVLGGTSALVATDDRLCLNDDGAGVVCYDRDSGAVLWATPFEAFDNGPNSARLLLVEGGPPGAAGDTLFASGPIYGAGGQPRGRFVALDAEGGAVLDWNVGPVGPSTSNVGLGMATLAGDGRLYLGGFGIASVAGQPRRDLFAVDRTSAALLPWAPNTSDRFLGARSLAVQADPGGGPPVVYSASVAPFADRVVGALDGETGTVLDWNPRVSGGSLVNAVLLAERTGWVVVAGEFAEAGGGGHSNVVAVRPAIPFAVAEEPGAGGAPAVAALSLAGPNPFRSRTALALTLSEGSLVEASLYDVLGRRVAVLHDGVLGAGTHALDVDASGLPAGVYVARVAGTGVTTSVTLTVVR